MIKRADKKDESYRKPKSYHDLLVWQKGIALVKSIYRLTKTFPAEERFGLIDQMRRAAISIPSNITEGQARRKTGEFIQFISYAEGSLAELDTQVIIAIELEYCSKADIVEVNQFITEIKRMLNAIRRKLT